MGLPIPPNITFDLYHASTPGPPHAPDIAGCKGYLRPYGQSSLTTPYYTHKLWVDAGLDIRDGTAAAGLAPANPDGIWVPNSAGNPPTGQFYKVILVRRIGRGTALDCYLVLLLREQVTWPQNNL